MPSSLEIPALPVAYVRALQLMREPDADVNDLVRIGNDDPAFAGALMRLANSAESSPLDRVRTIRAAVVRLGTPESRRTIIGVTLKQAFRGVAGSQIDEREFWRHLVSVGMLADEIAWGRVGYTDAFTAGLLHDIGRLAMAAEDPKRYGQVVMLARATGDAAGAERRVLGLDHAEWGGNVGRRWGFPDDIMEAIAAHHHGEDTGLAWVVHKAREESLAMGIGDGIIPGLGADTSENKTPHPMVRRVDQFVGTIQRAA